MRRIRCQSETPIRFLNQRICLQQICPSETLEEIFLFKRVQESTKECHTIFKSKDGGVYNRYEETLEMAQTSEVSVIQMRLGASLYSDPRRQNETPLTMWDPEPT